MRLAAIDIGSNSVRCTIVEVPVGGARVTLDEEKAYVRLGRGTIDTGRLAEEAMDEAVSALDRMLRIAREFEVTLVRAVATAAVREAENGADFVERIRAELGLEVEVISGEHEGRLALFSAVESLALSGPLSVVDIGGGSVEVVQATGRELEWVVSLPLGAVVLSEFVRASDPMSAAEHTRLTEHVRSMLAGVLSAEVPPRALVGSGGTVTTLAAMVAAERAPGLAGLHGLEMTRDDVARLRGALVRSTARERGGMKGLSESRIDLIVAGAIVLDEVMDALGATSVLTNARGMREGIIIETVEREMGMPPVADRMRSVREFGRQCRNDVPHAEQVRRLALALFDGLVPLLGLDVAERPLLEAAALLHDVGYHISFERHHKHSYHLISHADLPGFSASERRLIAAIARYHSGSLPKAKHEALQDLSEAERDEVSRLAALLRIADGLDRARAQKVAGISLDLDGNTLSINLDGDGPLDIEAHGATRKSDLFKRVWGRSVRVVE